MSVSTLRTLWRTWIVPVSAAQIIVAAALLLGADTIFDALGSSPGTGIFDEVAHVSTALLCLNLLPERWRRPILLPALLASCLIDLDHLPQYIFGTDWFTQGTPRPYTHSLTTVVLCLGIALLWRRRRVLWIAVAAGLLLHFLRDMAEGSGTGVALLWPLSDHSFAYSHRLYLAMMAAVVLAGLLRVALRRLSSLPVAPAWRDPARPGPHA